MTAVDPRTGLSASILSHKEALDARIQARYDTIPSYIKEDLREAITWAEETLTKHEGAGHHFSVYANKDGTLGCAFSKPQWSGDHSWTGMDTAEEAIVMSVVSYLEGG